MELESLKNSKFAEKQITSTQMYTVLGGAKRTEAGTGKVAGYDDVEMAWDSDKIKRNGTIRYRNLRPADCDCKL